MSTTEKISQLGGGVKDLAIGVGIAAAVGVVVYAVVKGKKIVDVAQEGAGFVFGTSQTATLGTWLNEKFSREPAATDPEAQQIASCSAILRDKGRVISPVCQKLQREGKLYTVFIPKDFVRGYGVD